MVDWIITALKSVIVWLLGLVSGWVTALVTVLLSGMSGHQADWANAISQIGSWLGLADQWFPLTETLIFLGVYTAAVFAKYTFRLIVAIIQIV